MEVEWEVPENIQKAKKSLDFMLKGCKCKGGCSTRRCSCKRSEKICGPSCQCINCTNIPTKAVTTELETLDLLDEEQEQEEEYVSDSDDELDDLRVERETDDIMRFVFGDSSASDDSELD